MHEVLPVLDLTPLVEVVEDAALAGGRVQSARAELCERLASCLRDTGCVVVRDPRVDVVDNERLLDMMERYFSRPAAEKEAEARPQLHYQVGVTPGGVEVPRCIVDTGMAANMQALQDGHKATMPNGPDLKWRFFWRVGPRPATTRFAEFNAQPVIPQGFPEWASVMDSWGTKMLAAVETVAQGAALGFGLKADAFTSRMALGPHLLAPTGTDLAAHGQLGAVMAGFHYDLNFLTIHGKSRFPGLHVWLRDGRRVPVRIPPGCLLLQAGKQLEWLTGGYVQAGMHEVVVSEDTVAAVQAAEAAGRSTWRVSSTVFAHIASDVELRPLGHFAKDSAGLYPPTVAGMQVQEELETINLKLPASAACQTSGLH